MNDNLQNILEEIRGNELLLLSELNSLSEADAERLLPHLEEIKEKQDEILEKIEELK